MARISITNHEVSITFETPLELMMTIYVLFDAVFMIRRNLVMPFQIWLRQTYNNRRIQFVIFKPLSYCFEETIRFDV